MAKKVGLKCGSGEEDLVSGEKIPRMWLHGEAAAEHEEREKQEAKDRAADEARAQAVGLSVEQWKTIEGLNHSSLSPEQWSYVGEGIENAIGLLTTISGLCVARHPYGFDDGEILAVLRSVNICQEQLGRKFELYPIPRS